MSTKNSYAEALTSSAMVSEDEGLREIIRFRISVFIKGDTRELAISFLHARTQQEGRHLQAQRRVLTRADHTGALILDVQPPEQQDNYISAAKAPSMQDFLMTA